MSEYIVYVARFDDVVMYVGEGKVGRDNHLNSGLSHVYQANRHHFAGLKLEIEVVATVSTKEEARLAEKRFIAEHCPIWNKIDTTFDAVRARKEYRRILERLIDDKKITNTGQIEVMQYLISKMWRDGRCSLSYRELGENTDCGNSLKVLAYLEENSPCKYTPKKLGKLITTRKLSSVEFIVSLTDYFKSYIVTSSSTRATN